MTGSVVTGADTGGVVLAGAVVGTTGAKDGLGAAGVTGAAPTDLAALEPQPATRINDSATGVFALMAQHR